MSDLTNTTEVEDGIEIGERARMTVSGLVINRDKYSRREIRANGRIPDMFTLKVLGALISATRCVYQPGAVVESVDRWTVSFAKLFELMGEPYKLEDTDTEDKLATALSELYAVSFQRVTLTDNDGLSGWDMFSLFETMQLDYVEKTVDFRFDAQVQYFDSPVDLAQLIEALWHWTDAKGLLHLAIAFHNARFPLQDRLNLEFAEYYPDMETALDLACRDLCDEHAIVSYALEAPNEETDAMLLSLKVR